MKMSYVAVMKGHSIHLTAKGLLIIADDPTKKEEKV